MNKRALVAGIILAASLTAPFAASALTPIAPAEQIRMQIKELLSKVEALQAQLKTQADADSSIDRTVPPERRSYPRFCELLKRDLVPGQRGDDVRGLQEFLVTEGYLNAEASGYFGAMTRAAVAKWQSANGISSVGRVGPASREWLLKRCGNTGGDLLTVSPSSGSAPLTVTITAKTGDSGTIRPSAYDGQDTLVDFGDGSERQWINCEVGPQDIYPKRCTNAVSFQHTYAQNGTYTVKIVKAGGMCPINMCQETVLATATVRVGNEPVMCTMEYAPVCGQKQVQCITTPCNPVEQTYGNRCMMNADGATFVHEGACRDQSENPERNPQCKAWNDGCNICSRSEPGGMAACTLRYCLPESTQKPYCTAYFDSNTGNKPPVISGFSGPTALAVHEVGTWSITAADPENGTLSYSILWGDEWTNGDAVARSLAPQASIQQQSSFTHSYSNPGTYKVSLTVTDSAGMQARSTATVQVSQTACTKEYAPVCARPQGQVCSAAMIYPPQCGPKQAQTYGNRCMANNANATILYEGACSGTTN